MFEINKKKVNELNCHYTTILTSQPLVCFFFNKNQIRSKRIERDLLDKFTTNTDTEIDVNVDRK